jgi:uncharacterized membrane protein
MLIKSFRVISKFLLIIFCCLTAFTTSAAARPVDSYSASEEEVSSFAAEIVVSLDGTISVTEHIDYFFPSARHGIYRDLPLRYKLEDGREVIIPLEVISVEGGAYELQRSRSTLRIKIGDQKTTVTGSQSYVIRYVASGALRYFVDHDELYWNVTGNDWTVPLRRVTARIYLPSEIAPKSIQLACYTGPYGSLANDCLYHRLSNGASFAADDALTIVVGWQPGLVARLEPLQPTFWSDYAQPYGLPIFLGLLIPVVVLIFMYRRWWQQGRDSTSRRALVVQYDPPAGLTPAEVGVLMDERADIRDISASIIDLAVRGYLKIVVSPKKFFIKQDYEFVCLKDFTKDKKLHAYEKEILSTMFGGGVSTTLGSLVQQHKFHSTLTKIGEKLYAHLEEKGFFPHNPDRVRKKYQGIGVILFMFGFCGGVSFFSGWNEGTIFVYLTMSAFASTLVGAIMIFFGKIMPCKTVAGVRAFEHARGFRLYLNRAEKYRLQWQEKENLFEKFLPYAMVFGVADKWTQAFKDMSLPPPKWLESGTFIAGHFDAGRFLGAMVGLESGLISVVSSRPHNSSSGSGLGGGFSGGGGGGGGGGSW